MLSFEKLRFVKKSLTYYLTIAVLKLKGIKKSFSKDPVAYKTIRKEDVYNPKGSFFKKNITKQFKVSDSAITEITYNSNPKKLLIFIHGGAFISGPAKHHWDSIKTIVKNTDYKIWMCNYPKAPESDITEISQNIDAVYDTALQDHEYNSISFIGDSVGGTLITSLMQRLLSKQRPLPYQIILISPVMDATMSNPVIDKIDPIDPMLSKVGILSSKKMCARNVDLKDTKISPIYGSFEGFPKTVLFLGECDIMYPDEKLALDKMKQASIDIQAFEGKGMPHIWPLLPVMKEAKQSLHQIIQILNENNPN